MSFPSYLLSMETAKDIEEYLSELLGKDNSRGREFQREFFLHWHPPERFTPSHEDEELMQELHRPSQEEMVLFEKKERAGGRQKEKKVSVYEYTNATPLPLQPSM